MPIKSKKSVRTEPCRSAKHEFLEVPCSEFFTIPPPALNFYYTIQDTGLAVETFSSAQLTYANTLLQARLQRFPFFSRQTEAAGDARFFSLHRTAPPLRWSDKSKLITHHEDTAVDP
jgi:hypothetical protein